MVINIDIKTMISIKLSHTQKNVSPMGEFQISG